MWFEVIAEKGVEKYGDIMKLLKGEHGVTHGYANTIALLYRQQAGGGPPPEEDMIAAQYAGPKEALRPVYEAILTAVRYRPTEHPHAGGPGAEPERTRARRVLGGRERVQRHVQAPGGGG